MGKSFHEKWVKHKINNLLQEATAKFAMVDSSNKTLRRKNQLKRQSMIDNVSRAFSAWLSMKFILLINNHLLLHVILNVKIDDILTLCSRMRPFDE